MNALDIKAEAIFLSKENLSGPAVVGSRELREHIESNDVRYGENVYLELGSDRFIGRMTTTGTDVHVTNSQRSYMIYSHMFHNRVAWNFMRLQYVDPIDTEDNA